MKQRGWSAIPDMPDITDKNQMLWHVPEWRMLSFLAWPSEDEVVVLQPASGDIHLLSLPAATILESLQQKAMTTSAILGMIESDDAFGSGITTNKDLESFFLGPLQHLGLVEKAIETLDTTADKNQK